MVWWGIWAGWSPIFSKYPFRQVTVILLILFFKSAWCKKACAARNWINSVPQSSSDDLCFLFCIYSSAMIVPWHFVRLLEVVAVNFISAQVCRDVKKCSNSTFPFLATIGRAILWHSPLEVSKIVWCSLDAQKSTTITSNLIESGSW